MVELRRVDGGGRGRRWREEDGGAVVVGARTVAAGGWSWWLKLGLGFLGDEDDDVARSEWSIG